MKKILLTIAITCTLCIAIIFSIQILKSEVFYIVDIKYDTTNKYIKKDITEKFELLKNKPMFLINISAIKKAIKKDIRVESVSIKRQIPSTLIVNIKEKEFVAVRIQDNTKYMLDTNLNPVIYFKQKLDNQTYPILYFENSDKEDIQTIFNNLAKSNIFNDISEIAKINDVWTIILKDNIKLFTNPLVESKKYDLAKELNEKIIIREYIDLRFKDINTK